jgi:hypothetical protein
MKLGRIGSHRANACPQELWGELIGIDLDQTAHIAAFELEKSSTGPNLNLFARRILYDSWINPSKKRSFKRPYIRYTGEQREHFEKSIGKLAHPGPLGSLRGT